MLRLSPGFTKKHALVIAFAILSLAVINGVRPFDDAYITYRYAVNIARGDGFVYNIGQRVLGTTTPLFALLLATCGRVFSTESIPIISTIIGTICDIVSGWLLFRLTLRSTQHPWPAWIVTAIWIFHPLRIDVSTGGMETALFVTLILAAYDRYLAARSLSTSVFFALAFLTRPEAVLAVIPIGIHWLILDWKQAIRAAFLGLLLILPWLMWATAYFGSPLPQSVLAKNAALTLPFLATFNLATFWATGTIGYYQLTPLMVLGAIVGFGMYLSGLLVWMRHQFKMATMLSYPLVYSVTMAVIDPPLLFAWYYPPLIPFIWLTIIGGMWQMPRLNRRTKQIITGFTAITGLLIPLFFQTQMPSWVLAHDDSALSPNHCDLGVDIGKNELIMAFDIGKLGYCFDQAQILDVIGLVSPEAIPYHIANSPTIFDRRLISDYQPDYIATAEQWISPLLQDGTLLQDYSVLRQFEFSTNNQTPQLFYILKRKPVAGDTVVP